MWCILKACRKCCGDLVLDGDEWRCWQCGRYYYPKTSLGNLPQDGSRADRPLATAGRAAVPQRQNRRASRDINSVIAAKARSDDRWWDKNREIIRYLDQGQTVQEISVLIGRGQRQIRVVRERLNDLRASGAAPRFSGRHALATASSAG